MKVQETYSKEESYALKTGLYAALVVVLITLFVVYGRKSTAEVNHGQSYEINARFNRTDGLLVGDKVRLAGVTIGQVVDAKLDADFKAILTLELLTLELDDNVKIPDDSSASIVSAGIMGSKYIEIEPGGSPDFIQPGGEFAYTQDAMVIEELIDRIISIGKSSKKEESK